MKLLFDQNLSPRLVVLLGDVFAGSLHAMLRKHALHIAALEQETDNRFLILL
ncbi:MAG TPA: hypothetical protein VNU71_07355 [Burkholderiaceae bacterium]|nr:hypothetical protein [Burkholderiaceae bacterium]